MPSHPLEDTGSTISVDLYGFFSRLRSPLYAIIDTARDHRVFSWLEESGCPHEMLYPKHLASAMDDRGPYLVSLTQDSTSLESLISAGWGKSWGVYLVGPQDFQTVSRHLRRQLFATLRDGRQALLRFYDPRVLRLYLPTCTETELDRLFGPITEFYLESQDGRELLWLSYDRSPREDNGSRSTRAMQYSVKVR